ncbi:MAG: hypothetical protein WEA99_02670 [Brumimicrobium sp.]
MWLNKVIIILMLVIVGNDSLLAQRKTKLNTNGKGTLFAYFGYNRSVYSASDVYFTGNNYDFSTGSTSFSDDQEGTSLSSYFSSSSPQFNLYLGYYIANKWALTFGMDRLNYFFNDNQTVVMDGTFSPDAHSDFSGTYNNEEVDINRNQLNIAQKNGLNYFRLGIMRTDQHYKSKKAAFAFNTNIGIGLGAIFSSLDYTFDGITTQNITSLSGWGISAHVGLQFDFFQHIFLKTSLSGGVINQRNIQLTTNATASAKHITGYISPEVSIGFNIFAKPTNGCGTCPQW